MKGPSRRDKGSIELLPRQVLLTLRIVDSLRPKGVELLLVTPLSQPVVVTEGRPILLNRIEGP